MLITNVEGEHSFPKVTLSVDNNNILDVFIGIYRFFVILKKKYQNIMMNAKLIFSYIKIGYGEAFFKAL